MTKYIFSNGTVRTTKGFSTPRRDKGKQDFTTVIIVFPNPVANQSEQVNESKKESNDDEPRSIPKN